MPLFTKHGLPYSVKLHRKKQPTPPISYLTRRGASLPTELMKGHSVKGSLVSLFFHRTALELAMIVP